MRILLVEDSEKLQRALAFGLRKAGFAVDSTGSGPEGLWMVESVDYDAVVLDLMLPGMDGLSVLRKLRETGRNIPVLILTAKGAVEDRVAGLRAGADDYLVKPFAFDELLARVEALVRRRYGDRNPIVRVGDLELDTAARTLRRSGEPVELTPREYRIIELLMRRPGEVVSRSELEEHVYADEVEVFSNAIESAISILRRKLDSDRREPIIQTRRGAGYCLVSDSS